MKRTQRPNPNNHQKVATTGTHRRGRFRPGGGWRPAGRAWIGRRGPRARALAPGAGVCLGRGRFACPRLPYPVELPVPQRCLRSSSKEKYSALITCARQVLSWRSPAPARAIARQGGEITCYFRPAARRATGGQREGRRSGADGVRTGCGRQPDVPVRH